ncbi:hypothetical protein JCM14469_24020 [Desulfatiferula olefinivorans]
MMKRFSLRFPLFVSMMYALFAGLWIVLSDRAISLMTSDPDKLTFLQTYKGWGFVTITAVILYLLLQREWARLQAEIHGRTMAEKALLKSQDRLIRAQRLAGMGDFTWDVETGEVSWSDALFDMLGYEKTDAIDYHDIYNRFQHPDDRESVTRWLHAGIDSDSRELAPVECRLMHKNGEEIIVRMVGTIRREAGRQPEFFVALQNITELKRREFEHLELKAQLNQAQKMESVGRLAGGVAHDYNNMLGVIIGYTELIMDRAAPDDPLQHDLSEILNAARRSADITRQLLAFARKQAIAPRIIDLNDTVEGMLKILRRLIGEDIDLKWQPACRLGFVNMDPSQIDQILANLCVNARDAIGGVGKLSIETDNVRFDEAFCAEHHGFTPGDYVMLAVSDDGCGMDMHTLENLFEPYYTTKDMGKGTGLGLATVYGIVKQNGGVIQVESEPSSGSTFRLYLPRHEAGKNRTVLEETFEIPVGKGETLLIVEDEIAMLNLAQTILTRLGYTVLGAASPVQALSLAEAHAGEIDLLITDVVMPEMNGRSLAEQLHSRYPEIKILFMSGYTDDVIAHRGVLGSGMNFVQKPFSQRDLAIRVNEALRS